MSDFQTHLDNPLNWYHQPITIGGDKFSLMPGFRIEFQKFIGRDELNINIKPIQSDRLELIRFMLGPYSNQNILIYVYDSESCVVQAKVFIADGGTEGWGSVQILKKKILGPISLKCELMN